MASNTKIFLIALFFTAPVWASVTPEYATNSYTEHELSRSEKKCIEEGYKMTYGNCSNQTAPADRCPYHDSYYRSCSQEQWCRNNNFTFSEKDCKLPSYPVKMCDNKYPMFRACQDNIEKACTDSGFTHQSKCQLTETLCPYSPEYGKCCNDCPDFTHVSTEIPAGYVASGPTCKTCDGIIKTNITEAPCDGYISCQYGPLSKQTPSCRKGKNMLYSACKTAEMTCKERGYLFSTCSATEDPEACPEHPDLKKCRTNCHKLAVSLFPEANIISENTTDPAIDISKKDIRSLYGKLSTVCLSDNRPTITINLNEQNIETYRNIFNGNVSNVNFIINYNTAEHLPINGTLENVRITIKGDTPDCVLKGTQTNVKGTLSLVGVNNICSNLNIDAASKFITTGNVTGNITLGKDSSLGIKGNLTGSLQSKSYTETIIKGTLKFKDVANSSLEHESIIFGCNSKTKISGGIVAETANIVVKQRAVLDTPFIKLISTGNNTDVPSTLSSLHLHKYSKLLTVYDDTEYALADNNNISCDDKYIRFLGSSVNTEDQEMTLEPSQLHQSKWTCQPLSRQQLDCN